MLDSSIALQSGAQQLTLPTSRHTIRACRPSDRKRVVGVWMFYEDVDKLYPNNDCWDNPDTPFPPPYDTRPVETKNRGMLATRKIEAGELIVRERPVIVTPYKFYASVKWPYRVMDRNLLQMVYWLEQEDRERFVQLHNCKSLDECLPLTGIVRTNAVCAEFPQSEICRYYTSVCLNISYANHSCSPNATYDFDMQSMTFTLRAVRDIAHDEEITITYTNTRLAFADRQAELQKKYVFTCTCALCSTQKAAIRESDERQRFISSTLDSLGPMWNRWIACSARTRMAQAKRDDETIQSLLRVMDEENVRARRLGAFQHLALMYASLGDLKNFKRWAGECVTLLNVLKDGEQEYGVLSGQWEAWLKNPASSPFWCAMR